MADELECEAPVAVRDMDEEVALREQKQTFLYLQVVEKGYDTEAFANFMNSKKGKFGCTGVTWFRGWREY